MGLAQSLLAAAAATTTTTKPLSPKQVEVG